MRIIDAIAESQQIGELAGALKGKHTAAALFGAHRIHRAVCAASFALRTGKKVIAVFENLVGASMDNLKWSRRKSVVINCIFMLVASLPCLLGYNVLSDVHLIGARDILDSEDFVVSNLMLPIGALIFLLFCVTKYGWGADKYLEETNTGKGMKMSPKLIFYFKYILPVLILVILISGLM